MQKLDQESHEQALMSDAFQGGMQGLTDATGGCGPLGGESTGLIKGAAGRGHIRLGKEPVPKNIQSGIGQFKPVRARIVNHGVADGIADFKEPGSVFSVCRAPMRVAEAWMERDEGTGHAGRIDPQANTWQTAAERVKGRKHEILNLKF